MKINNPMIKKLKKLFGSAQYTMKDLKTNKSLDFVISRDFYRVDVGLIIQRKPIFWNVTQKEIENENLTNKIKVETDYISFMSEKLLDFNKDKYLKYKEVQDDKVTDKARNYRENSAYFKYTDPSIKNPYSIQHLPMHNIYFLVK